jgi:hypothetical protein
MNVQAKPSVGGAQRLPFERIALVLQGGGALSAYQAGVYEALAESRIEPDWYPSPCPIGQIGITRQSDGVIRIHFPAANGFELWRRSCREPHSEEH